MIVDKAKAKEGEVAQVKWKWVNAKQSAFRPLPRSGFSLTVTSGNKAVMFGGVYDEVKFMLSFTTGVVSPSIR